MHDKTVQDIKTHFAPHDKAMFPVTGGQILWLCFEAFTPNGCVKERYPLSKVQI